MSQFFYIHPDSPQKRLINQTVDVIQRGGVIVYPTDSGYAIGCRVGEKQAIDRIIQLRQLDQNHHFTLICRDLSELSIYAKVDNLAYRLLKNNTPGPYTFILKGTKEVPRRLMNPKKRTIGIRVPEMVITQDLLQALQEPLLSTSMILPFQDEAITDPEEERQYLSQQVDLVIHGGVIPDQPTTMIDFSTGVVEIIREGSGDPTPFI